MSRLRSLVLAHTVLLLCNAATPPVKVSLRTSWPAPPAIVEAIETIALENLDAFFPLVDRLTDPDIYRSINESSVERQYQAVIQRATEEGLLPDAAMTEMNLALHTATPKIEAFYNYFNDQHLENHAAECGSWVDWNGEAVCDIETLARVIESEAASNVAQPQLLNFDHVYPSLSRVLKRPPRTAILYASPDSSNFRALHSYLFSLAKERNPRLLYVFRHVPPTGRDANIRSYLSGYGVALNLKKMDYLAVDDRNNRAATTSDTPSEQEDSQPRIDPIIDLLSNFPELEDTLNKTPLSGEELADLGSKAIQLIANSTTPLATLNHLSQNFPKYASLLGRRVVVNSSIESEIQSNSLKAQPGSHAFWLNGAVLADKDVNPFSLLRLLKKERETISALTELGISNNEAVELLMHKSVAEAQQGKGVLDGLFDASDRPESGATITWWNDIEKDKRYARWPKSLYTLLQPTFGGLPSIKLNLFNLVLVFDLSQSSSLAFITGHMASMINGGIPVRFGIVPILETENGVKMARLFHYMIQTHGRKETLGLFQQVAMEQTPSDVSLDWNLVEKHYSAFADQAQQKVKMEGSDNRIPSLEDIISGKLESAAGSFTSFEERAKAYAERLSTNLGPSRLGHVFFNGRHFNFDDDTMRSVQAELGSQMQHLQQEVYKGRITDATSEGMMSTYFYDQPTTAQKRNRYIYPANTKGSLRIYHLPELFSRIGFKADAPAFLYPAEAPRVPLTTYVIADLDSESGAHLVKEALSSIIPGAQTRVTFIHNPSSSSTDGNKRPRASWLLAHAIASNSLSKITPGQLLHALGLGEPSVVDTTQTVLSHDETFRSLTNGVKLADLDQERYDEYVSACRLVAREVGLEPGDRALLVNGRLVGPIEPNDFGASDFALLQTYEMTRRVEPVMQAVEEVVAAVSERDRESYARLISMSTSILATIQQPDPSESGLFNKPPKRRLPSYRQLESGYTKFEIGDASTARFHVAVLLDPLSVTGQRWSSLIQWLSHLPGTFIQVHLNPAPLKEMPLKSFYRYNLRPSSVFDKNGREIPVETVFEHLPIDPIYTLAMEVSPSWLVRPREALYDLDNLQLGHLLPGDASIRAVFDLDYLVVEGHAREELTNAPPRGLQLELVRSGKDSSPIDDTQVVENLGYIQFKAKPGVFGLGIRKGRGREIFTMESVGNEGWNSKSVAEVGNVITVTSFEGVTLYPRLGRQPGMELEDVLEQTIKEEKGLFQDIASKVSSIFQPKAIQPQVEEQAEINIFTVASGLLYERFASIMILSVLRNTNSTVKFWFIENFLSPSFLEFIPHMAEKYNFKYELVTYKWPSWLREQTEKQRIIWAYKILFLDVLFPMDLKKVIFVDADQIVRADLKELVDLDLHGAPYGYTPMGDDNTDMEGFRFWKTGYWKQFLEGKPYHISALYVVDLVRFRQLAAGDILRGSYQALSADPNSLANLDQDLPNNLQREVPIYSLHEDWLWCETWCSKDRLHRAKTIDLCQNPLTKEPKLSRARKIQEWEEYDSEIAQFTRKLVEEGRIHSGMAAADANVLANAGSVPVPVTSLEKPQEKDDNRGDADGELSGQPRDEL